MSLILRSPQAALLLLACLCGSTSIARADGESPLDDIPVTKRKSTRTLNTATAWMPRAGEFQIALALDQQRRPIGDLAFGLGRFAQVGATVQRDRAECYDCGDHTQNHNLALMYFKMGLKEGTWFQYMPAVALIFRKTLPKSYQRFSDTSEHFSRQSTATPTALITALASKALGPVAIHIGAELLSAQTGDGVMSALPNLTVRPVLGLHFVPPSTPATTLLVDLKWIPSTDSNGRWGTVWNLAAGVRYKALAWADVDLTIRLQEGESASGALISLGVRGHFQVLP